MDVQSNSRPLEVMTSACEKGDVNNNRDISRASLSSSPPSCPSSPKSPLSPYLHQPPFPAWYWPHVPDIWYSRFPFYINPHVNEQESSKEEDTSVLTAAQALSNMNTIHLKQTLQSKNENGGVHGQLFLQQHHFSPAHESISSSFDNRYKERPNSAFERPYSQGSKNSEELKQKLDSLIDVIPTRLESTNSDDKLSNTFDNQETSEHVSSDQNSNRTSSKSRQFSCKYCDKDYMSLGALKMHIRTHTLPCKCKICGKAFSRPWLLQGHVRTHTGERPFSCDMCGRAFADRSNLRAHLQTHSDVKKYCCQRCGKTFSRMQLLARHEEIGCYMVM